MFSPFDEENRNTPSSRIILGVPPIPQPSDYFEFPLVPLRREPSTHQTRSDHHPEANNHNPVKEQDRKHRLRWKYSPLDTVLANRQGEDFEPVQTYELERNLNSDGPELNNLFTPGHTSYPSTSNYSPFPDERTLLNTPSASFLRRRGLFKPLRRHPFSHRYEVPKWRSLASHTILCFISYPLLLLFVLVAKGRTLFWTRVLVGIGSGITGVLLGRSLINLSRRHLEATVWATVIHQSQSHDNPGVQFKDIARHVEDPMSILNGLILCWNRFVFTGTARKNRAHYDSRFWSFHALFFVAAFSISVTLPFIFARIVDIDTQIQMQNDRTRYNEIAIEGDISDADNQRALAMVETVFNNLQLSWTFSPYSSRGDLPPIVEFPWNDPSNTSHIDSVYFSQPTEYQLQPDGHGFGTFETEVVERPTPNTASMTAINAQMAPGSVIRQPQWGIRIKCDKISDGQNNILPKSQAGLTYIFVPKDTVANLLDYYGKPFPTDFPTAALNSGDQEWPANVDQSNTLVAIPFWPNDINFSYFSRPLYDMGEDGTGFVSLEVGLTRLNTSFAPQGQFPVLGEAVPDVNGTETHVGYDAVICIELFEPWVVDVHNASMGSPTSLQIVEKGNMVADLKTGKKESRIGEPISDPNVRRNLTSERIRSVYVAAHQNSINQLVKDNGSDTPYAPTTTAIDCTNGTGAFGYTSLSATRFEKLRARSDATNLLPYMTGSGQIVVRSYPDHVLAFAAIETLPLIAILAAFFVLGLFAALFVPKLPKNVPRRGFDLYSWLAAFYADELVGVDKPEGASGKSILPIERMMEVEDIEQHVGGVRFRYAS